jgi:hypothetical protein
MADGDVTIAMSNELGLRLEDSDEVNFTQSTKITFLSKAQRQLADALHDAYLTELEVIDTSHTLTIASPAMTNLNSGNGVLRGGKGIKRVGLHIGGANAVTWATELSIDQIKSQENQYLAYSDTTPRYYIYNNKINILVTTTSGTTVDVYYLKPPPALSTTVDPILNTGFQDLIITLAESTLWRTDDKLDRKEAAYQLAMQEIEILNKRYKRPEGIGTKGRDWRA